MGKNRRRNNTSGANGLGERPERGSPEENNWLIKNLNHNLIEDARKTAKDGNWHEGETAKLNRDGINDLDYLEDEVNKAGFSIESVRNPYDHNNIRLQHPDHPDLTVVIDKSALQKMLSSLPNINGTNYDLSDVLTKINTTMADSISFMDNTNTVTIASRINNQPAIHQENKGEVRNLIMNIEMENNSNKDTLFQNIDDYIANNR